MQKRLSRQEVERLHELADSGLSHKAIAERLGIADSVVSYHRIKVGERRHRKHKFKSNHAGKNKHENHKLIEQMVKEGRTYREIREATGCCHVTVWQYKKSPPAKRRGAETNSKEEVKVSGELTFLV